MIMIVHQLTVKMPNSILDDRDLTHRTIWKAFGELGDGTDRPFIYRVTPRDGPESFVEIRSTEKPNLTRFPYPVLFMKDFEVKIRQARYEFRFDANPSRRDSMTGKRYDIYDRPEQMDWLENRLNGVATVESVEVFCSYGVRVERRNANPFTVLIVGFTGVLHVVDPVEMGILYTKGIRKSKVWGAGMMSLKLLDAIHDKG